MLKRIGSNMIICLCALMVCAHSFGATEATDFPGVRGLMSEQQFDDAGLRKLSPEEIKALDRWLIEYTANDARMVGSQSEAVKKAAQEEKIETKIAGKFDGWTGKTVFRLDNGQVWQQRLRGRYHANAENAEVVIEKNWMGFHRLTVVSSGRSVGVKRIK